MTGDSGLTILAAVLASAASLMAIMLGIDQLTSGARLRSLEAMLRGAKDGVSDQDRASVLASMHTVTVGQLVARDAVPGWKFAAPWLLIASALAQVLVAWTRTDPPSSVWSLAASTAGATFVGGPGVSMLVNLGRERARVARCFRKSVVPVRAYTDLLALMEGGTRDAFLRAYATSLALVTGGVGVSLLLARNAAPAWVPLLLILVSVTATPVLVIWFRTHIAEDRTAEPRNRDGSLSPTWAHPRDQSALVRPHVPDP